MRIRPYVGAYWGSRQEPLDACADRATRLLQGLCQLHPALSTWYEKGGSRKDALRRPVLSERDAVLKLLDSGRNRRDTDRSIIEDLGFSMGIWNGREPSVGLSIGCGKYPPTPNIKNAVVVDLPSSDDGLGDLASPSVARATMNLLVTCWAPDWATWTSREWREEQDAAPGEAVLGWMTYLSGPVEATALPDGVLVEPFDDGAMITVAEDISGVTGPVLAVVRESLGSHLRPVPVETRNPGSA